MIRRFPISLPLAVLLMTTIGCGYNLRGTTAAAPEFTDLRLQLPESEPEFERVLLRSLQTAGIGVHEAGDAGARNYPLLTIGPELFAGRPASTTVQARAAQITLRLAVRVNLTDGETALIDRENLSVERTYYQDLRNIAGNREEAELLREEMRRDLAAQLMRRLEAAGR